MVVLSKVVLLVDVFQLIKEGGSVMAKITGGVVHPISTAFTYNDEFDEIGFRGTVEYAIKAGVQGLWVMGSMGQGPHMSIDERKIAAEVLVDQVKGRVPVIVCVGTADTRSTIMLAKHAESLKIDYLAVLPLYYGVATENDVIEHFKRVQDAVPSTPLFEYDNMGTTQFHSSAKFLETLFKEVPNVKGCKPSQREMDDKLKWLRIMPKDFLYMEPSWEFLPTTVILGAKGTLAPAWFPVAEAGVDLWKAFEKGDWNVTMKKMAGMDELLQGIRGIAGREAGREVLRLRGVPIQQFNRSKSATKGASPEVVQKLAKFLTSKGIQVKESVTA